MLSRSELLLRREDADIAKRFTELLGRRVDVRLETSVELIEKTPDGGVRVRISGAQEGQQEDLESRFC